MKPKSLLSLLGLAVILLSEPSMAESFEDGYAAYGRGDYASALQIWKSLADQGNQSAEYGLGELYSLGRGVSQDDRQAATWYERAASSGHVRAQSRLGAMYDEGRGVPKSLSKAMKWYRKAARQGDLHAQVSLGLIYATGRGVPQNYFQAINWFRLAAEQGDPEAQFNLGLIYADGYNVVARDDVEALVWFSLAAAGGSSEAKRQRQSFVARMKPEEVRQAEKSIQDWLTSKANDRAAKCSMSVPTACE